MDFLMVLVILGLQRFLHFGSGNCQWNWTRLYCTPMLGWLRNVLPSNPFFEWILLLLPFFLVLVLLYAVVSMIVGFYLSWLFSAVLLWYCMDLHAMEGAHVEQDKSSQEVVDASQKVFSIIFWFVIGVVGMIFYKVVYDYHVYSSQKGVDESDQALSLVNAKILAVMDWLPQRLLGLSFVLLSSFSQLWVDWLGFVKVGLLAANDYLSALAVKALDVTKGGALETSDGMGILLDRSLIMWLLVMLLFYLGTLF